MMHRLVGLLGAKGAGKDTAATLLVQKLGFVRLGFADALYREVMEAFGVTMEFLSCRETKETPLAELALVYCKDANFVEIVERSLSRLMLGRKVTGHERNAFRAAPRSPRWILQQWGTEYRRRSRYGWDSYWLDQVSDVIAASPEARFVITDVRFPNEADYVEQEGGLLARVRRPVLEALEEQARLAGTVTALHPSETELVARSVHTELINQEGDANSLARGLRLVFPELAEAA
jgi:hypothetical protein